MLKLLCGYWGLLTPISILSSVRAWSMKFSQLGNYKILASHADFCLLFRFSLHILSEWSNSECTQSRLRLLFIEDNKPTFNVAYQFLNWETDVAIPRLFQRGLPHIFSFSYWPVSINLNHHIGLIFFCNYITCCCLWRLTVGEF